MLDPRGPQARLLEDGGFNVLLGRLAPIGAYHIGNLDVRRFGQETLRDRHAKR